MSVEIMTVSELEQQVIEDAVEYVQQIRNGLYRDVPEARRRLIESVDRLLDENEGWWRS